MHGARRAHDGGCDRGRDGATRDGAHPLQEQHGGEGGRHGDDEEHRRAARREGDPAPDSEADGHESHERRDEPRTTARTGTAQFGARARGAGLGGRTFARGGCVGARLQLGERQLGAGALQLGVLALRLRLTREALLGEGRAGVEFEAHFLRGLARLGEDPERLVQPHRVPLSRVELVTPLPRGQQVHQPQHDCDEDDDTTAENLATHGVHGRAEGARAAASLPRV